MKKDTEIEKVCAQFKITQVVSMGLHECISALSEDCSMYVIETPDRSHDTSVIRYGAKGNKELENSILPICVIQGVKDGKNNIFAFIMQARTETEVGKMKVFSLTKQFYLDFFKKV